MESTMENVRASIEAVKALLASGKIDNSPNDHHVNVNTTK